jgi:hypothetical protein
MAEGRVSEEHRRVVTERAGGCCEYCRSPARFSSDSFSIEHITPRARGGASDPTNLALSCQGCNNRKFIATEAIDPSTGELAPLYNPREHRWSGHFAWNEDFTVLVGMTPTGRATIVKLALNRVALVNLRRVLRAAGEHPPASHG